MKSVRLPLFALPLAALLLNCAAFALPAGWPSLPTLLALTVSVAAIADLAMRAQSARQGERAFLGSLALLLAVTLARCIWLSAALVYRFAHDPLLRADDLASVEWMGPLLAYFAHVASLALAALLGWVFSIRSRFIKS